MSLIGMMVCSKYFEVCGIFKYIYIMLGIYSHLKKYLVLQSASRVIVLQKKYFYDKKDFYVTYLYECQSRGGMGPESLQFYRF